MIGNTYFIVPMADHRITVSMPDGSYHRFRMHPDPESQSFIPITTLNGATLEPLDGTTSILSTSDPPAFFDGVDGVMLDGWAGIYSPSKYTLTLVDGSELTFTRDGSVAALTYSLTEVKDANGNTLTFTPTGITHSAGASLGMTRDTEGRITSIIDALGNVRTYDYDAVGDLVAATDFEGNVTQFIYDDKHQFLQILDPRGFVPGTLVYNDAGQIVAYIDVLGRQVALAHSASQSVIFDRLGNQTIYGYDARGYVTSIVNALGEQTTFTYDDDGNILSRTDALSNSEFFTYDLFGNMLTVTDALSRTSSWNYDANGRMVSRTDANGHTHRYNYDAHGNTLTATDPLSNTTQFVYNSQVLPVARVNALGYTTT